MFYDTIDNRLYNRLYTIDLPSTIDLHANLPSTIDFTKRMEQVLFSKKTAWVTYDYEEHRPQHLMVLSISIPIQAVIFLLNSIFCAALMLPIVITYIHGMSPVQHRMSQGMAEVPAFRATRNSCKHSDAFLLDII